MVSVQSTGGGYTSGAVADYHRLGQQRRAIYRRFSFPEAVQARSYWRLALVLGAAVLLIGEFSRYAPFLAARLASLVWSTALAATASHNPAGLPAGVFTFIVVTLVFLAIVVICVLLYVGYFRDPKDERAAMIVEHFAVGVFGYVIGKHF